MTGPTVSNVTCLCEDIEAGSSLSTAMQSTVLSGAEQLFKDDQWIPLGQKASIATFFLLFQSRLKDVGVQVFREKFTL